MKVYVKKEKGITLIVLVIIIIILLILAGISINMLSGENGLLKKAQEAKEASRKAFYQEEVELIIMEKQIEKTSNINEKRQLIELVAEAIRQKEWQKNTIICDDEGNEVEERKGTKIIVETKDGYEIIVKIDNERLTGNVQSITKETNNTWKISFYANEGKGSMKAIEVLPGTETGIKLSKNTFIREGWKFKEWNTKSDGTGTKYADEATINEVSGNIALFAIWEENINIVLSVTNNEIVQDSSISIRADATTGVKNVELKNGTNILYTEDYNGNTTYAKENLTYPKENVTPDSLNKVAFENLPFGEVELEAKVITQAGNAQTQSIVCTNYTIGNSTALEQFAGKVDEGNSFSGKTIYLLTSFTVVNHNPIGTWDNTPQSLATSQSFSGTFDGNKKTITITSFKSENRRRFIWSNK